MAIDFTDPVGQVRLLTADLDEDAFLLSDQMITGYLSIAGDSVHRAAAAALDAIASSEVLVSKKIRSQDLQTDGPAVAAELRAQAASLREQADIADGAFFEIVDTNPYPVGFEASEIPRQPYPEWF